MIRSFGDRATKDIYEGKGPKGIASQLLRPIRIRLNQIAIASHLGDLKIPPSSHLEAIQSIPGRYSIRVTQKYRIVFRWDNGHAESVQVVDYKH